MSARKRKVDAKSRIVLPEQFAGKYVVLDPVGETEVRVRIVRTPRRRPSLKALLSGVPANYQPDELEFGPPVGEEQL